jgi:hypothetical protein
MSKRTNWKKVAGERLAEWKALEVAYASMDAEVDVLRADLVAANERADAMAREAKRLEAELRKAEHERRIAVKLYDLRGHELGLERNRGHDLMRRLDWMEHNPTDVKVST